MTADLSAGATPHTPKDWHSIQWKPANEHVRRLQARLVKATKAGKWHKVQALQHLLTRLFSGKALAVRRVTENQGKNTPGVDSILWNTPEKKWNAVHQLKRRGYRPRPLRRVYIPKSNGKLRPLGIPTMKDRAMQALHLLALDPIAETLADPNAYGFRKARSCADAMDQCYNALARRTCPQWMLDGDIKSCFDQISHEWLKAHIPMDTGILQKWLKAGYMEKSIFPLTIDGTPQGGISSPALANMALDGLEGMLRQKYHFCGRRALLGMNKQVNVVRYADDFIITGISKEILEEEIKPLVTEFLRERGLVLSEEKTPITHSEDGFDFLGQQVRKYNGKFLTRPSNRNLQAFLTDIREVIKGNGEITAYDLLARLNPKIRGWARRRHPNKGRQGVKENYFGTYGNQHWRFFGELKDRKGKKIKNWLYQTRSVPIRRHVKIKGDCNPYDPAWELYLEQRLGVKMEEHLRGKRLLRHLWREQSGICPVCNQPITTVTGGHTHHIVYKTLGGTDSAENRLMVHPNCHSQIHAKGLSVPKIASLKGRSIAQSRMPGN